MTLLILFTPSHTANAGTLTLSVTYARLDQISPADFDFKTGKSRVFLFAATIGNPTPVNDAVLEIIVSGKLADGRILNPIGTVVTLPFAVSGSKTITNSDIGTTVQTDNNLTGVNSDNIKKIEDEVRATSKLPFGAYTFAFRVYQKSNLSNSTSFPPINIEIINPTRPPDLVSPANDATLPNQFPLFQWIATTFKQVELEIREQVQERQPPEDVMINGVQRLLKRFTTSAYQYLQADPTLVPGKKYYWTVRGIQNTGNVETKIPAQEIRLFQVTGQTTIVDNTTSTTIRTQLENALGQQFKGILDQIKSGPLSPTGTIQFGGVNMSIAEFIQLMNDIQSGKKKLSNVTIE